MRDSMSTRWISLLLLTAVCHAQTTTAVPGTQNGGAQSGSAPASAAATIVVPQGTSIALTLVSQIRSKSTKPGDSVRAVVAFPVTAGTQVAIPAGTYVEGTVQSVAVAKGNRPASAQIHFTRLLFANGYGAALDAVNTQAMLETDRLGEVADLGLGPVPQAFLAPQQSYPTPPPLPHVGPPMGPIIGATFGGVGVLVVLGVISHHHHGNADYLLFDNGWQFQMVLQTPLSLDAARVAAAASMPATSEMEPGPEPEVRSSSSAQGAGHTSRNSSLASPE
jgi:hypothetical protein